jgi:hypothetical protein
MAFTNMQRELTNEVIQVPHAALSSPAISQAECVAGVLLWPRWVRSMLFHL